MIVYETGAFGFRMLFRLHGSAVFKSMTPSLISSLIFIGYAYLTDLEEDDGQILDHPYPMGALISALTFLLAFRANFSYNRYYEALTAVYQMHSKWLDVGMELAAFHLQASVYDDRKPPSFGAHPELQSIERQRDRLNELTLEELGEKLDNMGEDALEKSLRTKVGEMTRKSFALRRRKSAKKGGDISNIPKLPPTMSVTKSINKVPTPYKKPDKPKGPLKKAKQAPMMLLQLFGITEEKDIEKGGEVKCYTTNSEIKQAWKEGKPPLFLQEAAHLISLLSAVAFSTLRNDLERAESPLIGYTPGDPWPHVDPDSYGADIRKEWELTTHRSFEMFRYLFGITRSPAARTLYNAARPFRVIGGISDAEIEMLQAARGPLAKVALCSMWLQEFITREYLNGSVGAVAPPILSRLYQNTSDGMIGYNQARKVAYIPFPFPHAQITSLFVSVVVLLMPILMISFVDNLPFGFMINLITVMCFTGLHEVARELENPFQNVPNDIPLNNFQAQFNEALITMFFGYHPDAYWEVGMKEESEPESELEDVDEEGEDADVSMEIKDDKSVGGRGSLLSSLFIPPETKEEKASDLSSLFTPPTEKQQEKSAADGLTSLFTPPSETQHESSSAAGLTSLFTPPPAAQRQNSATEGLTSLFVPPPDSQAKGKGHMRRATAEASSMLEESQSQLPQGRRRTATADLGSSHGEKKAHRRKTTADFSTLFVPQETQSALVVGKSNDSSFDSTGKEDKETM